MTMLAEHFKKDYDLLERLGFETASGANYRVLLTRNLMIQIQVDPEPRMDLTLSRENIFSGETEVVLHYIDSSEKVRDLLQMAALLLHPYSHHLKGGIAREYAHQVKDFIDSVHQEFGEEHMIGQKLAMDPDKIRKEILAIREATDAQDWEKAGALEGQLHQSVMLAYAYDMLTSPKESMLLALSTRAIAFPRWKP